MTDEAALPIRERLHRLADGLIDAHASAIARGDSSPAMAGFIPRGADDRPSILVTPFRDEAEKHAAFRMLGMTAVAHDMHGVVFCSEVWTAPGAEPGDPHVQPRDSSRRREAVSAWIAYLDEADLRHTEIIVREIVRAADGTGTLAPAEANPVPKGGDMEAIYPLRSRPPRLVRTAAASILARLGNVIPMEDVQ